MREQASETVIAAAKRIANSAESSVCDWDDCVEENKQDYLSYAQAVSSGGYVIVAAADLAALVEALESDIAVDCIACDCGEASPTLKSAQDRLGLARSAITPELLARVKGALT